MRVETHALADAELAEAAAYLEAERVGYGDRFIFEVIRTQELLGAHPYIGPPVRGRLHRKTIRGFSYDLVYRVERDRVFILALAHQSRQPNYWRGRR